jgi:probable F420-dependent oxidoreductase
MSRRFERPVSLEGLVEFGISLPGRGPLAKPDQVLTMAARADALGYASVFVTDHIVLPASMARSVYPYSATRQLPGGAAQDYLEPLALLGALARETKRARLGTSVLVVPYRHPLVTAKILATLDRLSGGRIILGAGVGWLREEFEAVGAPPFEQRGAVTDEYLAAMRAIWSQARPAYQGRFVSFADVQAHPQPVQRPHPPIVIGGRTAAAFRRAVQQGHGWYGFALDADGTARALEALREAAQRYPRPAALGPLEISITPGRGAGVDLAGAEKFAALGVHRLILMPSPKLDGAGLERFVEDVGTRLVGRGEGIRRASRRRRPDAARRVRCESPPRRARARDDAGHRL